MAAHDRLVVLSRARVQSPPRRRDCAIGRESRQSDHQRNHAAPPARFSNWVPAPASSREALLARGVSESDLTLIEYGSDFMRLLQARFPRARVLWMDAAWMASHDLFETPLGAVVSGLPLLNFAPRESHRHSHRGIRQSARRRRVLSIHLWNAVPDIEGATRSNLGLQANCMGRVLLNVPPASVYRITRSKSVRLAIRIEADVGQHGHS